MQKSKKIKDWELGDKTQNLFTEDIVIYVENLMETTKNE